MNGGLFECVIMEMVGCMFCSVLFVLGKDIGEFNNIEFNDVDDYIILSLIFVIDVLGMDIFFEY